MLPTTLRIWRLPHAIPESALSLKQVKLAVPQCRTFRTSQRKLRSPVPLPPHEPRPPTSTPPSSSYEMGSSEVQSPHFHRASSGGSGGSQQKKEPSRHADWYRTIVPAMIPVAILGTAVYMGLKLGRAQLSHEKYVELAKARVAALESELDAWRIEAKARELEAETSLSVPSPPTGKGTQQAKSWWTLGLL